MEQRGQIFPDIDIILNVAPLVKLFDGGRWRVDDVCLVVTPPMYVTLFMVELLWRESSSDEVRDGVEFNDIFRSDSSYSVFVN